MTTPETENCPICQDELKNESTIRTLPCSHKFHKDCIQKWIEMRNLCPLCKKIADTSQPVRELDDDRTDLTQQMIDNLIHGSINQSGVDFWMRMLQGFPMSSLGGFVTINRLTRQFDDGESEIMIEDVFSSPIQSFDLFDEFSRSPFEFTGNPYPSLLPRPRHLNRFSESQRPIPSARTSGDTRISESNVGSPSGSGNRRESGRNNGSSIRYSPYSMHPPPLSHLSSSQTNLQSHSHLDCPYQAQCANCYIIGCTHVIKRCGRCRQIRYCSRECQESNWPQHRDWCNAHRQQNSEEKKE
jgi:hypothetical protein